MTMPMVGQRVAPDATMAIAPNAAQPAAAHEDEGASATPFGAVLTLLLEHTGMAEQGADGAGVATVPVLPTTTAGVQPQAPSPSPVEIAADATLDDATRTTLVAALAGANAAAAPPISITADAIVAADAKTVRRELDLLAPDFRDRLERVIDRMESEFGYKVEISETYRTQARQDALYAQGRTEPGQVVTWTRTSNHTAGRAADLVIDGASDEALPYERLMRVAREEGLRTLGARDPGHVEMSPPVASLSSIVPTVPELESAGVAPVARVAQVAQVAQVAVVGAQVTPTVHAPAARPRSVDQTAARGLAARRNAGTAAPDAASTTPLSPSSPMLGRVFDAGQSDAGAGDDQRTPAAPNESRRARARIDPAAAGDSATEIMRQSRDELVRAVAGVDPTATSTSPGGSAAGSAGIAHADMSERIARLLKVQDAAADRPMSQMMLRLERPDGGEDRLRVDLRGSSVSATLDVGDQGVADRMGANVKELQRVLERHGFEADSITVRSVARSQESAALTRAASASLESDLQRGVSTPPTASTNTSSRDRGARHDEQRPSPDSQRQRSRREQKGDR